MSDFYVTLYSDKGDEQATIGTFNTILHKPIIGSFEVALVEISFSITWKVDLGTVRIQNIDTDEDEYIVSLKNYDYSLLGELCDFITYKFSQIPDSVFLKSSRFRPQIRYLENDGSIKLSIEKEYFNRGELIESDKRLRIDDLFAKNFRFNNKNEQFLAIYSHFNKSLVKIISHLYVHCDIIANQFDGESKSKLLRIIPVSGRSIDVIHITFNSPHYCTVNKTCINSIEMSIKDHLRRNIKFESGRVIFKLHFRKK